MYKLEVKLKSIKQNNQASFSYFFIFILLIISFLTLFAVASPLMQNIASEFYSVGDDFMQQAQENMESVGTTKALETASVIETARGETDNNVKILDGFIQYAWLVILVVITFVIFITARAQSQRNNSNIV